MALPPTFVIHFYLVYGRTQDNNLDEYKRQGSAIVGPYTRETECMWIWLFFGLRRVVPNCEVFFELTNRVASSKVILRKSTKIFVIFFMPNVRCSSY